MCVLTPILQMGTEAQRGLEVTRGHGARERQGSCRPGCPPCRAAPRPVTLCLSCPQLYQAEQESGGGGWVGGHSVVTGSGPTPVCCVSEKPRQA